MTFFQKQSFYRESKNPKPKKKAKKFFASKHASVRDGEKKKRGARFHGEEREKRQKGSAQTDRQKRKHATDARRTTEEQRLYRDTRRFGQVVGEQQKRRGEEEEDEEDVYD